MFEKAYRKTGKPGPQWDPTHTGEVGFREDKNKHIT